MKPQDAGAWPEAWMKAEASRLGLQIHPDWLASVGMFLSIAAEMARLLQAETAKDAVGVDRAPR